MATKRPRVDMGDGDLEQRVEEYADEHGLKRPRAYAELLRNGLACEGEDHVDLLDKKVPGWREEQ